MVKYIYYYRITLIYYFNVRFNWIWVYGANGHKWFNNNIKPLIIIIITIIIVNAIRYTLLKKWVFMKLFPSTIIGHKSLCTFLVMYKICIASHCFCSLIEKRSMTFYWLLMEILLFIHVVTKFQRAKVCFQNLFLFELMLTYFSFVYMYI